MREWAALHEDVVFGRSGGRIIWQPRILCWYTDKQFAGEPLPAPYTGLPMPEIYRRLGCSDRLYNWYNPCFRPGLDPGGLHPPAHRVVRPQAGAGYLGRDFLHRGY